MRLCAFARETLFFILSKNLPAMTKAAPPRILTAKEARKLPMIKSLERTFRRIDKTLRAS